MSASSVDHNSAHPSAVARDRSLWRQARRVLQRPDAPCPSPCLAVCQMSPQSGLCLGCWRSLDEIARWGSAPQAFQRAVWQRIEERLQAAYPQGLSSHGPEAS